MVLHTSTIPTQKCRYDKLNERKSKKADCEGKLTELNAKLTVANVSAQWFGKI